MDVKEAIERRRAYRALEGFEVDIRMIRELVRAASLAPSCFNKQPWRFIFVYGEDAREKVRDSLSRGNEWAKAAALYVAVLSKKDLDCIIGDREYYLFDTGLATAFMILRATEMGLVAHPIAGYDPEKVKEALGIPAGYQVITLIVLGRHLDSPTPLMSQKQKETERKRPERLPISQIAYIDTYGNPLKE